MFELIFLPLAVLILAVNSIYFGVQLFEAKRRIRALDTHLTVSRVLLDEHERKCARLFAKHWNS